MVSLRTRSYNDNQNIPIMTSARVEKPRFTNSIYIHFNEDKLMPLKI
jgi:hypothetical protein